MGLGKSLGLRGCKTLGSVRIQSFQLNDKIYGNFPSHKLPDMNNARFAYGYCPIHLIDHRHTPFDHDQHCDDHEYDDKHLTL